MIPGNRNPKRQLQTLFIPTFQHGADAVLRLRKRVRCLYRVQLLRTPLPRPVPVPLVRGDAAAAGTGILCLRPVGGGLNRSLPVSLKIPDLFRLLQRLFDCPPAPPELLAEDPVYLAL